MIDKTNLNNVPSFLKSESVGIYTLRCLHLLDEKQNEFNENLLNSIIKDNLVPCVAMCKTNKDLLFGASGFLHALLLLKNKLEKSKISIKTSEELLSKAIIEVVEMIIHDCVQEVKIDQVSSNY